MFFRTLFTRLFFLVILLSIMLISCRRGGGERYLFHGERVDQDIYKNLSGLSHSLDSLITIDMTGCFDNPGNMEFASEVKDFHAIVLETQKDLVLGGVDKVTIYDSMVFVLDRHKTNNLYIFRIDGSFFRTVGKKGKGPGEYVQVTDFFVDVPRGLVTVYDQYKASLLDYSLSDGSFRGARQALFRFHHFTQIGGKYIMEANSAPNEHIPAIDNKALIISSSDLKVLGASINKLNFNYGENDLMKVDEHWAAMSIPFVDTIFHTDGVSVVPRYAFLFDERIRLPKDLWKRTGGDFQNFRRQYPRDQYAYFNGNFVENTTHLFWSIAFKKGRYHFYYDKQTGQVRRYNRFDASTRGSAPDAFFLWGLEPVAAFNNMFIGVRQPQELLRLIIRSKNMESDAESEAARAEQRLLERFPKLKTLTADDNPVLILFKL